MNLYDLPKDMLVKLVTTIQEDTEKRCFEKFKRVLKNTTRKFASKKDSSEYDIEICSSKNCTNVIGISVYDSIEIIDGEHLQYLYEESCQICDKYKCSKHIDEGNYYDDGYIYLCNDCEYRS